MNNLWRSIVDGDVLELMRLCGCEKKYIAGNASDFECFAELCRIYPYLEGHAVAEKVAERIKDIFRGDVTEREICAENACALWKKYNRIYFDDTYSQNELQLISYDENLYKQIIFDKIKSCIEKDKFSSDNVYLNYISSEIKKHRFCDVSEICDNILNYHENINVYLDLCCNVFTRPDEYHANGVIKRISDDEKCKESEYNLLFCQIICELISQKKCEKIQLHINACGHYEHAKKLISYLSRYRLGARIFIAADVSCSPEGIADVCSATSELCRVTPELFMSDTDSLDGILMFTKSLARVYPIGYVLSKDE